MRKWNAISYLAIAMAVSFSSHAQTLKPSVIYDMGGKFDKSFNQSAYNGAEQFKKETGITTVSSR